MIKKILFSIVILVSAATVARSQSQYQPYSYQFYQKLDATAYSTSTSEHTALRPFFVDDSILKPRFDSLMNYNNDRKQHGFGYRKLFMEHLIDIKNTNNTFYADFLPDFTYGKDFEGTKRNTTLNSYGFQLGGTVTNKFYYNISGYLDQGEFPDYLTTYINQVGIVPGEAYDRTFGHEYKEWSYITAIASYTPVKFLNISAGRGNTFVGDGYRSVLLSDYASPYPFVRLTAHVGSIQYMAMWGYFDDPIDLDANGNDRKKWGVFHYLDWNVSKRITFGFYDSVIWYDRDDAGHYRGFDVTYLNPITFLRPLEATNGSPDNALIGFTGKYKITNGIALYGQFALDEFQAKQFFSDGGSSRNKYSYQLGIRGANMFGIKDLNYLLESNNAKPYTYSERGPIINYSENGEPLAQPWGANYREVVGLLNYSYKRFDYSLEGDYGHYGLDINGLNYGKDIFFDYTNPAKTEGNYIGQGLTTNMYYAEGKIAYLLNPKYNLRIELGGILRDEKNAQFDDKTAMLTIGIRSSFRTMYTDLASYKVH